MKNLFRVFIFTFISFFLMGLSCNKYVFVETPKQSFIEKLELSPSQKTYSVNDTIWLYFQKPDKTLFDTLSNQSLSANTVKFLFNVGVFAKYDFPIISSGIYCDFVSSGTLPPNIRIFQNALSATFEVGCDNFPGYDVKVGVVLKNKGYYILDMSSSNQIQPCLGQTNPYPLSSVKFKLNLIDTNKDVYLSIPASARNDFPAGYTESQLDYKVAFAYRVQ